MPVGFGKKIMEAVRKSRMKSTAKYDCPKCSRKKIRREASGIWSCSKCNAKFASGAYEFRV